MVNTQSNMGIRCIKGFAMGCACMVLGGAFAFRQQSESQVEPASALCRIACSITLLCAGPHWFMSMKNMVASGNDTLLCTRWVVAVTGTGLLYVSTFMISQALMGTKRAFTSVDAAVPALFSCYLAYQLVAQGLCLLRLSLAGQVAYPA